MELDFYDSSALTKLFVQETGTNAMLERTRGLLAAEKSASSLAVLEVRSALRRRQREGDLSETDATAALRASIRTLSNLTLVPLQDALVYQASELIDRHRLKALDALQLASALNLHISKENVGKLLFVGCDVLLLKAASIEGLAIWSPEVTPLAQLRRGHA